MRAVVRHPPTNRQLRGVSSVAAPLLAAASITVVGVIIQQPTSLAVPWLALTVLSLAAASLVTSINGSIWASYYEAEPDGPYTVRASTPSMTREEFDTAVAVYRSFQFWSNASRLTYTGGVYALWIGLGAALVPSGADKTRLLALIPIALAIAVETFLSTCAPKAAQEPTSWLVRDS